MATCYSSQASPTAAEREVRRGEAVRGRCMLMCPEKERTRRQKDKCIHVLEVAKDGPSEVIAVKEYVRAGAGHLLPHPDDLRPPAVLATTMEYLIRNVAERTDYPWYLIYQFISNRIQSIRQDITFQQLEGDPVRYIYETASKFYLYSQYRLWGSPIDQFDSKLNMDHLQQCMAKLIKSISHTHRHTFTALHFPVDHHSIEYEAYYLLINLGNTEVLNRALDLRFHHHPQLKLAFEINMAYLQNNFVRLFRLVRQLSSPFQWLSLLTHVTAIRSQALQTMSSAYSTRSATFPLELLERWLLLDSKENTCDVCTAHGVEISGESVLFRRGMFHFPSQVPRPRPFTVGQVHSAQVNRLILGYIPHDDKDKTKQSILQ